MSRPNIVTPAHCRQATSLHPVVLVYLSFTVSLALYAALRARFLFLHPARVSAAVTPELLRARLPRPLVHAQPPSVPISTRASGVPFLPSADGDTLPLNLAPHICAKASPPLPRGCAYTLCGSLENYVPNGEQHSVACQSNQALIGEQDLGDVFAVRGAPRGSIRLE